MTTCICGEWKIEEYGLVCPSCPAGVLQAVDSYREARAARSTRRTTCRSRWR